MKMRLIDADDLLRDTCNECKAYYSEAKQSCPCNHGECDAIFTAKEIQNQPTIEAEPIKHGEWIPDDYEYNHCSECSYEHESPEYVTPYCPNCGAKMEE